MTEKLSRLYDRALMLACCRDFFTSRGVKEVDCPLISNAAPVDLHIELMTVHSSDGITRYLPSSPEYMMKRLLAAGMGDIYQLAHVFRDDEISPLHNPEFMMAEWYRQGFSFEEMVEETLEFIFLFLPKQPVHTFTYHQAFRDLLGMDLSHTTDVELLDYLHKQNIQPYSTLQEEGRDAILNVLLAMCIEPKLKELGLCVLSYYPPSQAALAQTCVKEGIRVAERFEIYCNGIELANGYHELSDPAEQRARLLQANHARVAAGKTALPIDEAFLHALDQGLPNCCGVAVGFDRLMMLRHSASTIASIMPFSWQEA